MRTQTLEIKILSVWRLASCAHSTGIESLLNRENVVVMPKAFSVKNLLRYCLLALVLAITAYAHAKDYISIAFWNLEHLNERNKVGCVPRNDADYQRIADQIRRMNSDVVAFQEVENATAAQRVFPESNWTVIMSDRPNTTKIGRECRGLKGQHLRHLGTGIAIRSGLNYVDHPDLSALGTSDFQRWGTDVTIDFGTAKVRFLSVHLASGCWGAEQDGNRSRGRICETLREQIEILSQWMQTRVTANEDYVVLGDFNRRLALPDDWAWHRLSSAEPHARLITRSLHTRCDPRYTALIDHLIASQNLARRVLMDRLAEHPRDGDHPDHCAIQAFLM